MTFQQKLDTEAGMKQKLLRTISMILVVLTAFSTGIISKAGAEEQKYWINPNGGSKYHRVHHCPSIHPRYYDGMIEITEDQLSMNPYNMLSPCNVCMDLDPADYDLPIGEQGNLTSAAADTETLQDLVIQHAKDTLTEVYGYTEEQAKDKIADVLAVHIVYATSFGRPFHPEEYEKELNQLK